MKTDVIIVGGGASGLMAAITCQKQGRSTLILEQKDRVGKKILATGNGKCNFTNQVQDPSYYRSKNPVFVSQSMKQFGALDTIAFFERAGVLVKDKNGYLYPYSGQAATILEALELEAKRCGVSVLCGQKVLKIEKKKGEFFVSYGEKVYVSKSVIIATGGKASPKQGSDGSGYILARKLGHTITELCPALTGLKAKEGYCKDLSGVRTDATVSLMIDSQFICKDTGELQLTNYGISGIPVFQICRFAGMALLEQKEVTVKVDFYPNWKEKQLRELVKERVLLNQTETAAETFGGFLNRKILLVLLKQTGISPTERASCITEEKQQKLCKRMKGLEFHITDTNGFENAQVCAGGIDTSEVNPDTMESKLVKDLYFCGELLDVDGICGGYNLQWAWTSGYIAGLHAGK